MSDIVEIRCDSGTRTPTRRAVRLKSADFQRQALVFDVHTALQGARAAGAMPVDWRFTAADAEELAIELGLSPDVDLTHCTLDDLPISVSDDIERSSLRAVRGPEILSFPLNALGGPVRLL